jgi:hypothetical protein
MAPRQNAGYVPDVTKSGMKFDAMLPESSTV